MIRTLPQISKTFISPIRNHAGTKHARRCLFTNTDLMKKDDPYATLGIQWGATTTEIKDAFKKKARELHPDVNKIDNPEQALKKFQQIQQAYSKLLDVKGAPHRDDLLEEWSFAVWRNSDVIAQERDDVAGVLRKRPIKPVVADKPGNKWGATLGHPSGSGNKPRRAEYLGDGRPTKGPRSNTVGTVAAGFSKKYKPWSPDDVKSKGVSR